MPECNNDKDHQAYIERIEAEEKAATAARAEAMANDLDLQEYAAERQRRQAQGVVQGGIVRTKI